jgi:hypothetical protein
MPFDPPCFAPDFFFDDGVLRIVQGAMDERVVADQWGCDVPLSGSQKQEAHVDYQRPLFAEVPDLPWSQSDMCAAGMPTTAGRLIQFRMLFGNR